MSNPPSPADPSATEFSHLDDAGAARMVNVASKPDQMRRAVAGGFLRCAPETIRLLKKRALPKGDVLTVAQIAGIQAAKSTSTLIPMCHPLPLHGIEVAFEIEENGVRIQTTVETTGKTGVEMEALMAASVAALTIYDMCKAVDKSMVIEAVQLLGKTKS